METAKGSLFDGLAIPAGIAEYLPSGLALVIAVLVIMVSHWWLLRRRLHNGHENRFSRQLLLVLMTLAGVAVVILLLPFSGETRGQIISVLGLVITGIITLSSTTVVANALAGFMLRSAGDYRPGDFIKIGDHMGRVTERGLFHTEIQTEQRDLTILPNLYLVTHPMTVIHKSGTVIFCDLSLGYDVERHLAERLLLDAAAQAELTDAFVQVRELGDFSVVYRVSGFLQDVTQLITLRSNLKKHVLDSLHGGGVEIASPTLMNTRQMTADSNTIPEPVQPQNKVVASVAPEQVIFDKAEAAQSKTQLSERFLELEQRLKDKKEQLKGIEDAKQKQEREFEISEIERQYHQVKMLLEHLNDS